MHRITLILLLALLLPDLYIYLVYIVRRTKNFVRRAAYWLPSATLVLLYLYLIYLTGDNALAHHPQAIGRLAIAVMALAVPKILFMLCSLLGILCRGIGRCLSAVVLHTPFRKPRAPFIVHRAPFTILGLVLGIVSFVNVIYGATAGITRFEVKEVTYESDRLPEGFDAYAICTGTPQARDLAIPGRDLAGIHFAMEMLAQQNRVLAGQTFDAKERITAKGKRVLVIGGGDTGSDCIGTAHRQGALSVTQIEIMPQPPVGHNPATPWPQWPVVLKTSSSHEEGCTRRWSLNSNRFIGRNGRVTGVEVEEVEWLPAPDGGRPVMKPTGRKEVIKADLVLLAMGFLKPQLPQLPQNAVVAGDAATGPSLVVKCIAAGRRAAADIDRMLNAK